MSIRIGIGIDNFASGGIDSDAQTIFNRIIADGGVSNLTRLDFFIKGLKAIYGDLVNVPVCYDAHWIGYKLGSGTGATAGQAAAKLYSLTVAGDAIQSTAASQPLLLAHNGASSDNYWWGSGVAGNYVTTPNAVANQITDNVDLIAYINGYKASVFNYIIVKGTIAAGINYSLSVNNQGFLRFNSSLQDAVSTVSLTNQAGWVRATRQRSNGEIKFYFSLDAIGTNPQSVTWTQLGTTAIGSTAALTVLTAVVNIGNFSDGVDATSFANKIYRATISNSIGGAPVVDFNPATYNAATSQTAWASATGEVWTINTGTADGYKGLLVDRTYIQGDGIDDVMITTSLSSRQYYSSYAASRLQTFSGVVRGIFGSLAQSNLIYVNTTGDVRAAGLGILQFTGEVNNRLQLFTANFQLASGSVLTNNLNRVSGSLGGVSNTSACILSDGSTGFGNFVFSTGIQSSATDSIATNTATYNLIRSLNNNAF